MSAITSLTRSRVVLSPANLGLLSVTLIASFCVFAGFASSLLLAKVIVLACAATVLLVYPECALAGFLVVGDIKGDPRIAVLFPCDLTLAVGAILVAGMLLNLLRKKRIAPMPTVYFLFAALVVMMTTSLIYTPVLSAGVKKLELFITVTAIAIVAPFFVLPDTAAMKRFLWCFGGAAYAICLASLAGLGGQHRLVTPSENTIGLGRVACIVAAMIWASAVPGSRLKTRCFGYAAMIVPLIAMLGSGSRGSAIAFALLVLATLIFYKRLALEISVLVLLGLAALPFADIPQASFRYLGSLFSAQSVGGLLDFRGDLLAYGWRLVKQHPLFGAGLGGFRYSSPNPGLYKWPHDIFIELACELGIPAALIGCAIFASAIRESFRQLRTARSLNYELSVVGAALLWIGLVTAVTTGNINSDRTIWFFVSVVFVVGAYQRRAPQHVDMPASTVAGLSVSPVGEAEP